MTELTEKEIKEKLDNIIDDGCTASEWPCEENEEKLEKKIIDFTQQILKRQEDLEFLVKINKSQYEDLESKLEKIKEWVVNTNDYIAECGETTLPQFLVLTKILNEDSEEKKHD